MTHQHILFVSYRLIGNVLNLWCIYQQINCHSYWVTKTKKQTDFWTVTRRLWVVQWLPLSWISACPPHLVMALHACLLQLPSLTAAQGLESTNTQGENTAQIMYKMNKWVCMTNWTTGGVLHYNLRRNYILFLISTKYHNENWILQHVYPTCRILSGNCQQLWPGRGGLK